MENNSQLFWMWIFLRGSTDAPYNDTRFGCRTENLTGLLIIDTLFIRLLLQCAQSLCGLKRRTKSRQLYREIELHLVNAVFFSGQLTHATCAKLKENISQTEQEAAITVD